MAILSLMCGCTSETNTYDDFNVDNAKYFIRGTAHMTSHYNNYGELFGQDSVDTTDFQIKFQHMLSVFSGI